VHVVNQYVWPIAQLREPPRRGEISTACRFDCASAQTHRQFPVYDARERLTSNGPYAANAKTARGKVVPDRRNQGTSVDAIDTSTDSETGSSIS
jgi:hypothetical protein